jgi:tetraacyldisaccharide 4'-kinase
LLSHLYGRVARLRRRWYARHPDAARRLAEPVISIGNLTVGGSGKTPFVAFVCRLLIEAGERPAILTRGYGRSHQTDGVTVVQDPSGRVTDLARAGDEPLMLARQLPGTPILVSTDRYLAGRLAASKFAATVHVLDDGFQHLQLRRDVNLLLVDPEDLRRPDTLPGGRLREPLEAGAAADAVLVFADDERERRSVAMRLGVETIFRAVRVPGSITEPRQGRKARSAGPVLTVAGVARPERFAEDVARAGREVSGSLVFGDHHRYSAADVARIERAALDARASAIVTTEKDYVRLESFLPLQLPVLTLPLEVGVHPAADFRTWLLGRIRRDHAAQG